MEKIIELKYNKWTKLVINECDSDYILTAQNDKNDIVGICQFYIVKIYSRPLDELARKQYAKRRKISLDKVPTEQIIRVSGDTERFRIEEDSLTDAKGRKYKFSRCACLFSNIIIQDAHYYKVGLGSAMYHELENIALEHGCEYVEAFYHPNGPLQFGAHDFYVRNGFEFRTKGQQTYVVKDLTTLRLETESEKVNGK